MVHKTDSLMGRATLGDSRRVLMPTASHDDQQAGSTAPTRALGDQHAKRSASAGEQAELLRIVSESTGVGLWIWDLEADTVIWENDRPYEIFGIPRNEPPITGELFTTRFLYAEDREAFDAAVRRAKQASGTFKFLGRFRRTDGQLRWLELYGKHQAGNGTHRIFGTASDVTDRMHAQENTRRASDANAKFRTLFEQGSQFAGILSIEGTVLEANELSLAACGYSRADVLGKPFWECGWWNRSRELAATIERACRIAAAGEIFRAELPYFVADGSERIVDFCLSPVADETGRVLYLAPTGTDITERKSATDAMRESEQRFRTMADSAPVLIWMSGPDGKYTWFNEFWLRFVGRAMERELGTGWTDGLHPEDQERWRELYSAAFENRQNFSIEYRIRRHDGEYRWMLDSGSARFAADGAFAGYIGSSVDITDRKVAELGLVQLAAIVDSSNDAIVSKSLDGVILSWNASAARIFGYSAEEAVGRHITMIIPPERLSEEAAVLSRLRKGEKIDHFETERIAKDGRRLAISLSVSPLKDRSGRIIGASKIARDITPLKDAAIALNRSDAKLAELNEQLRGRVEELQALLNVLPVGVFVAHDPQCSQITANDSGLAMLGITRELNASKTGSDAESLPFRVLRNGVEVPGEQLPMQRAARTGIAVVGEEYEIVRSDGTSVSLFEFAAPLFDAAGTVRGSIGAFVDISDLKRAQRALDQSQAESERQRRLYEAILDNTPDFAYIFSLDHRFTYVNQRLKEMFGANWDASPNKTFLEIGYPAWHAELHSREIEQVRATKQPVRGEVPFDGAFGRRIYDYIFVPVLNSQGEVEAVAGTTRDVTDSKELEAEREALLDSERSARSDAERASRIKDEFLATLSHELRTPLNAILGWTHILLKTPNQDESLAHGLSVIYRNARMQAQLIADLLDMSRIISGKMRLDVQRVELPIVIEAALESIRPAADAKKIRIESIIEPISEPVRGDPARLQQVVWNLVSNAVKFTPSGGKVQVVLARVNSHIELSVTDTGPGISQEFLPFIFERFRQVDSSASREHGGLGLGLAIVKQLVELHGGKAHAASEGEGKGATFVIHLPLSMLHEPDWGVRAHPRAASFAPPAAEVQSLEGIRVLVVDDEADARELAKRVLEERGAQVILAASADAAFRAIQSEQPTVILSDIGMPECDGYAMMRRFRSAGITLPAAAITAFARSEDRTHALHAGYQTHLSKPVEPTELIAAVASLARKGSPPPAAAPKPQ
jgi:PAS domain S-box-containing protein